MKCPFCNAKEKTRHLFKLEEYWDKGFWIVEFDCGYNLWFKENMPKSEQKEILKEVTQKAIEQRIHKAKIMEKENVF